MTGSLIIAGYDVLSNSSPVKLMGSSDADFGSPVPDTNTVKRLLTDGDVVSGDRSANRSLSLPLFIDAGLDTAANARIVADFAACVNQQQWTMKWIPDAGMTAVVFDMYRGSVKRDWSLFGDYQIITITCPALPWTRDAAPTVLAPPNPTPPGVVLDACDNVTGAVVLPAASVADEWSDDISTVSATPDPNQLAYYESPEFHGDAIASTVAVDTTTYITSTGSVKLTQPVVSMVQMYRIAPNSGSSPYTNPDALQIEQHQYTPFTFGRAIPAGTTDMTPYGILSWYAKCDVGDAGSFQPSRIDPTTIGVASGYQDNPAVAGSITNGTWVFTLWDTSSRMAQWVTASPLSSDPTQTGEAYLQAQLKANLTGRPPKLDSAWTEVFLNLLVQPDYSDAGFDMTQCASYRLRYYMIDEQPIVGNVQSPELYPTATPAANGVNLLNCTSFRSGNTDGLPGLTVLTIASTGGSSTTFEASRAETVPVTAGLKYSARCGMTNDTDYFHPGDSQWGAATFQCGIEWLNSSNAVIQTDYGTASNSRRTTAYNTFGEKLYYTDLAEPVVQNITAPTGATHARVRARMIPNGTPSLSLGFDFSAPRIVQDTVAWRYPYYRNGQGSGFLSGEVPIVHLWLDNIVAHPGNTGVTLTAPFGVAPFRNIQGVGRSPINIAVAATTNNMARCIIARTPNPRPGFTGIVNTPSIGTGFGGAANPTADAKALSGQWYACQGLTDSATHLTYTLPSNAYSSTYDVLVRYKVVTGTPTALTLTAFLAGDSNTQVISNPGINGNPTGYVIAYVGAINLPPRGIDKANASSSLQLQFTVTNGTTIGVDLVMLIDKQGEAVIIDTAPAGTGASTFTKLFLDSPDSQNYIGQVFAGNSATRSDAVSMVPFQVGQTVMNFDPGYNQLTIVMDNLGSSASSTTGTVSLSYYPRWIAEHP